MLQQDLQTQNHQNGTAGDLGLLLKSAAEDIADLNTGSREAAGTQADQHSSHPDVYIARHGQGNTHRQSIDGCCHSHDEHGLNRQVGIVLAAATFTAGALTFPTETTDGDRYTVTVNGEENIVWLTTILSIDSTVDELTLLKAVNDLTGTKNPVTVHVEHKMNILMMTMCFNAEMTDKDIDAVMDTWWTNSEIALRYVLKRTNITIDWNKKV